MANQEQLEILRQGVDVWNKWREENPNANVDLSEVELIGANLRGANLWEADLFSANLSGSNLIDINLMRVDLSMGNLKQANLSRASLFGTNLSKTNFGETNLSEADLGATIFGNVDLSEAIGLKEVHHYAPSILGLDSISRSRGKYPKYSCVVAALVIWISNMQNLPNLVLTQSKLPKLHIELVNFTLGPRIEYYSCFISYSSKDHEFAQHLYDDLQNNGVRCWFDREDLKIGDPIRPTIDREIRLRDKLLVILSENSVKSEWVGDEVEGALEDEQRGNRLVLFPIRLDDTVLNAREDWAAKIKRRRHIGDFSNWQNKKSYQKAFERLLRDLKATETKE